MMRSVYYVIVLVYTKTVIHLCVGGWWWIFSLPFLLGEYPRE